MMLTVRCEMSTIPRLHPFRQHLGTEFPRLRKIQANPRRMRQRIIAAILRIPRGRVSTYGAIARAAGYPGAARQVARALHHSAGLPWQRVVGAGGAIKIPGESGLEQRFLLQNEGVAFRGRRVDMQRHEYRYASPRLPSRATRARPKPRRAS